MFVCATCSMNGINYVGLLSNETSRMWLQVNVSSSNLEHNLVEQIVDRDSHRVRFDHVFVDWETLVIIGEAI